MASLEFTPVMYGTLSKFPDAKSVSGFPGRKTSSSPSAPSSLVGLTGTTVSEVLNTCQYDRLYKPLS
jgi:hypothetical protein